MILQTLYVLPMLLGRTYDARSGNVGIDIFASEELQKAQVDSATTYRSTYAIIETTSDVRNMLNVQGELSLRIKSGAASIDGYGSFIKDSLMASNSVDILTAVNFRTYTKTLRNSAVPVANWLQYRPEDLGTHYVQSVLYGGDLITSISFKATESKYLQDIKATVKASLGTGIDLVAEGKLEMLEKRLEKKANMKINYYATVPLDAVPYNATGLRDLIRNFGNQVKKVNNGWGRPVEVILQDLANYGSKTIFLKNKLLEAELTFFEEEFDDLLSTKSRLKSFVKSLPPTLTAEHENQIEDLRSRISSTLRVFYDVIGELDLEKDNNQLQRAFEAYQANKKSGRAGTYKRELDRLLKKLGTDENPKPSGSSVYIHYGVQTCGEDTKKISTLYSGYLASSTHASHGSGSNYLCLPDEIQFGSIINSKDLNSTSIIKGIKYGILENVPFDIQGHDLTFHRTVCAVCFVKKPSVVTVDGRHDCNEGWEVEYQGFLMAPSATTRGQYVCMDRNPLPQPQSETATDDQRIVMVILQDEHLNNSKFVPCVVCSL